jgi:hypothetical protein
MKSKPETIDFLLDVLYDLKQNYEYNDIVIDKVITHLQYQKKNQESNRK